MSSSCIWEELCTGFTWLCKKAAIYFMCIRIVYSGKTIFFLAKNICPRYFYFVIFKLHAYTWRSPSYNLQMHIKEEANTKFDQNQSLIQFWPKLASSWVSYPSKPQNTSNLGLGMNIYHVPFFFHKQYLQDLGCLVCLSQKNLLGQNICRIGQNTCRIAH